MTQFAKWCSVLVTPIAKHDLVTLEGDPVNLPTAVTALAKALPQHYASPQRLQGFLDRLNRKQAAKMVSALLPTKKTARSGDLGEILCAAYVFENAGYRVIPRLRWKDHREMAMRGDDVLGFGMDPKTKKILFLKAEVKSRAALDSTVIDDARAALCAHGGLPSAHALLFAASRAMEMGDSLLQNAIDDSIAKQSITPAKVKHMIFTFSGSSPKNLLTANLESYAGPYRQHYVGLRVKSHQAFIKNVYEAVTT